MAEAIIKKKPRPEIRNIHVTQIIRYRLPLSGWLSILNRITGALLFLALPLVLLPLLDKSLTSELSFVEFRSAVASPLVKLLLLVLLWSFLHHMCAGVRYLALDLGIGLEKHKAIQSAAVSFGVSLALTFLIGLKLFGVF